MSITITHTKTNTIPDWDQQKLDQAISQGLYPQGTRLADIVLPSDWNASHTVGELSLTSCTFATLPSPASSYTGQQRIVTDRNNSLWTSNGTAWKTTDDVLVDTYANVTALSASTYDGMTVFATDYGKSGLRLRATGGLWVIDSPALAQVLPNGITSKHLIIGGSGCTWSQTGTTITVTYASHTLTAALANGANVHLTQGTLSTGSNITTGWFTNFTYINANSFSVTSSVSQSGTGSLGSNTSVTSAADFLTIPAQPIRAGSVTQPAVLSFAFNSANNKVIRTSIGTVQVTSQSYSASLSSSLSTSVYWSASNRFFINGDLSEKSPSDMVWRASGQLANAAEWVMLVPYLFTVSGG